MSDVESILNHHLEAFAKANLDELLKDYCDESKIIFEDKLIKGLNEIKIFFNNFINNILPPGSHFNMHHKQVVDNVAYIVWSASTDKLIFKLGTDTFIINDDGKIIYQTVATKIEEK